jgi:hypothetical protein
MFSGRGFFLAFLASLLTAAAATSPSPCGGLKEPCCVGPNPCKDGLAPYEGICVNTTFTDDVWKIGSPCGEVNERCCGKGPECIHPGLINVGGYCKYDSTYLGRRYGASQCGGYEELVCGHGSPCLCLHCKVVDGYCKVPGAV